MKSCCALTLALLVFSTSVQGQEEWQVVTSPDGVLEALAHGEATDSVTRSSTLAGKVVTKVREFQADTAEFAVCSTKLSRLVRRLTSTDKLYSSARKGVLQKYSGEQLEFSETIVDGIPARLLRFRAEKSVDGHSSDYVGVAVILIFKNSMYAANALVPEGFGDAVVDKFHQSLRINRD